MDESLEKGLLDMEARDLSVRNELAASGELFDGNYHARMEEVHRANASRLRQIISVFGWPGLTLVGARGCNAAWRIAMHAIGEPDFMRQCRDLIQVATQNGDAPRWQFAFIDDRIRVFEGEPQRYSTQLRAGPKGFTPHVLEDDSRVNSMRMQAGLPPIAQTLAQANAQPQPANVDYAAREAAEKEWRKQVGWLR
jgi:hypothetical protein